MESINICWLSALKIKMEKFYDLETKLEHKNW
jgi:hypothetical protein